MRLPGKPQAAPQAPRGCDGPSELSQFNFDLDVMSVSVSPSGFSAFGITVKKSFPTQVRDLFSNTAFYLFIYLLFSAPDGKLIINQ